MRLCVLVLLFFIVFCSNIFPDNLTIISSPWPPFADKSLPEWGFTTEIIKEAFKASGHEVTFAITDEWKICLEKGAAGEVNGLYNMFHSKERTEDYSFSEAYLITRTVFVARKGSGIKYSRLEDLKPYTLCVMDGYINTKEFDEADFLTKVEVAGEIEGLKKLLAGNVDLVVMDKYVAIYLLRNSKIIDAEIWDVEFLDPPLRNSTIHVGFPKIKPGYEKYTKDFDKGFSIIKNNGIYDLIIDKHGYNITNPECDPYEE